MAPSIPQNLRPVTYIYNSTYLRVSGHVVEQLVEEQLCKQEGRSFDSRRGHWNFSLLNHSDLSMALGTTQPVTIMGTKDVSWVVKAAGG
jgi:hypothetical protein